MKKALIAIGALVVLLVCCGVGGTLVSSSDGGAPKVNIPRPVSATPTVKPAVARGVTDGEWLVGKDIQAGRYFSAGPDRDLFCYWQLTTEAGAQPGEKTFVTNDAPPGRSYVNLKNGEYFKTSNCAPWTRV